MKIREIKLIVASCLFRYKALEALFTWGVPAGELSVGNNIQFCTCMKRPCHRCGTHREPLFSQRLLKPLMKAWITRTTPTEGLRLYLGTDIFYKARKASALAGLAAGFLQLHRAPRGQFPLQLLENTTSGVCILFCLWTKEGGKNNTPTGHRVQWKSYKLFLNK